MYQSNLRLAGIIVVLLSLVACASNNNIPTTLVTQAESSIRQAESAGAEQHAPVALRDAKRYLASAKTQSANENYEVANKLLEKSLAESEFASAKSLAEKSERSADRMKENLRVLENEVNNRQ
ncbi:MAG TPA: DUF4398 domain-containing protein [Cellvibrionaceae bacterium]